MRTCLQNKTIPPPYSPHSLFLLFVLPFSPLSIHRQVCVFPVCAEKGIRCPTLSLLSLFPWVSFFLNLDLGWQPASLNNFSVSTTRIISVCTFNFLHGFWVLELWFLDLYSKYFYMLHCFSSLFALMYCFPHWGFSSFILCDSLLCFFFYCGIIFFLFSKGFPSYHRKLMFVFFSSEVCKYRNESWLFVYLGIFNILTLHTVIPLFSITYFCLLFSLFN